MRRLCVLAFVGAATLIAELTGAAAQSSVKTPVVARLASGSSSDAIGTAALRAFREGMSALGHVEGRSYLLESRFAEEDPARVKAIASELVRRNPDVIVVGGGPALRAAKDATTIIPIVVASAMIDPVAAGYVASLARPGGNVTGFSGQGEELHGKQLEFLREIVPGLSEVCLLYNAEATSRETLSRLAAVGSKLGLSLRTIGIASPDDLEAEFERRGGGAARALLVIPDAIVFTRLRGRIAALALRHRLPSVFSFGFYAEAGGLLSYSWDLVDTHRRAAFYVDRILKGAKPADLPVEQPTKFELVVNLKTAKALGIAIPQSILLRADAVIE